MRDDEYLAAFERGEIRNDEFRHRDHLRLAWACIRQAKSEDEACTRVCSLIRNFATAIGHAAKFDEALTVSWVQRLWRIHALEGDVPYVTMIAHNPAILDKNAHAAEAHSSAAEGDPRRGPVPRAA
jgi:hypothetical protein